MGIRKEKNTERSPQQASAWRAWGSAGYLEAPCLWFRYTFVNNCVTSASELSVQLKIFCIVPHGCPQSAEVISADRC